MYFIYFNVSLFCFYLFICPSCFYNSNVVVLFVFISSIALVWHQWNTLGVLVLLIPWKVNPVACVVLGFDQMMILMTGNELFGLWKRFDCCLFPKQEVTSVCVRACVCVHMRALPWQHTSTVAIDWSTVVQPVVTTLALLYSQKEYTFLSTNDTDSRYLIT